MDNRELNRILQIIQKSEGVNLSRIAEDAGVDRTYLSKLINLDATKPAGKNLLSKLGTAFPKYFEESTPQKQQAREQPRNEPQGHPEIMVILDRLSLAHKDLTESNRQLSKNQELIIRELSKPGRTDPKKTEADVAKMSDFLELLSEVLAGKRMSKKEALVRLSKHSPFAQSKGEEKDIQTR